MGWATNAISSFFSKFGGVLGVGITIPQLPKISIGDNFYPQVVATTAAIDRVERSFKDFTEPLQKSVKDVIIPSIQANFDAEGRPPWQELAEFTVEIRGSAHPILDQTGKLKAAATSMDNWTITREDASLTGLDAAVSYAKYHQSGTINMPQREFISYQPEDIDAIEEVFARWVDEKIARGGFV